MKKMVLIALLLAWSAQADSMILLPPNIEQIKQSAQNGDPRAQFRLGFLYEQGAFGTADIHEAMHWYRKAEAAGNKEAALSRMLLDELIKNSSQNCSRENNVRVKDSGDALIKNSADNACLAKIERDAYAGDASAQYKLGVIYNNGMGRAQNLQEAHKWYTLAAKNGSIQAQYALDLAQESKKR